MTAPNRETREEWRKEHERGAFGEAASKRILALLDALDEVDSCEEAAGAEFVKDASVRLLRIATDRFATHGARDARGAAFWDAAVWLAEERERILGSAPTDERLAAVRVLAEDFIKHGGKALATHGWALIAVLDDRKLAALTVKSHGGDS